MPPNLTVVSHPKIFNHLILSWVKLQLVLIIHNLAHNFGSAEREDESHSRLISLSLDILIGSVLILAQT